MATITGKIMCHDSSGHVPKPGVFVTIAQSTAPHSDIAAVSDSDGKYTLGGLSVGDYVISAQSTESCVQIETDDACVSCDVLVGKTSEVRVCRVVTRSSQPNKPKVVASESIIDSESKQHSTYPTASEYPPIDQSCNVRAVEQTRESESNIPERELLDSTEQFESDPYENDVDLLNSTESAPVSISLIDRGLIYATLSIEILQGVKDIDALTDKAWRTINPDENYPISTGDPDYKRKSAQWAFLRDSIVKKLISDGQNDAARPKGNTGPLNLVSVRMPTGPTHRLSNNHYKFGLKPVIDALLSIATDWHQQHPNVDLMIRDISREGGGSLQPPHKSHRCGLDVDLQLWVGNQKVSVNHPRYAQWRPLMQDLVDIVHANSVLPVKVIGFSDPQIEGVSQWKGHTKHIHVRFCSPPETISDIEDFIDIEYSNKPKGQRPRYRCKTSQFA